MSSSKAKKRPANALLSFGDDADADEEFVVLKSTKRQDKTHKHSKVKTASAAQLNTYFSASSGYSPEELEALKRNSFTWGSCAPALGVHAANTQASTARNADEGDEDEDEDGILPTEVQIRQAKLIREMARSKRPEPPSGTKLPEVDRHEAQPQPPVKQVNGNELGIPKEKKVKPVEVESDSDEDGIAFWEKHQMSKVGLKKNTELSFEPEEAQSSSPKALPLTSTELPSFVELHNQIAGTLRHMKNHCAQSSSANTQVAQDYQVTKHSVQQMTKQMAELAQQLQFFTEFKDYLEDLADCYDDKEKVIEGKVAELEQLHVDYFKDRMDTCKKDLKDEMEEVYIAFGLQDQEEEEVDEFGRSLIRVKQARALRRNERHRKRQEKRAKNQHLAGKPEGWSTDETDSEDEDRYSARIAKHLSGIAEVFDDVDENFASLDSICQRLEYFKHRYTSAYKDSYASLSLAMAFGPHVSIELAKWNPLKQHIPLEEFNFFQKLCDFGSGTQVSIGDAELSLVPHLIQEKVVPLATIYLCNAYNPLSAQQTLNARKLVLELLQHCSPTSPAMKQLFFAIVDTIKTTVAVLAVDHSKLHFDATDQCPGSSAPTAKAFAIVRRRFWSCVKLLHNASRWRGILSLEVLLNIMVKHLLCQRVLPHLQSLEIRSRDSLMQNIGVLNQCLDLLPFPLPDCWRDAKAKEMVQPVLGYIKRSLIGAYLQLSQDRAVEKELRGLWARIHGDPDELYQLLQAP